MPFDIWTNSILWGTADAPLLNLGTTNFAAICFAKNCLGNIVQPVINSQPTSTNYLGRKAWRFGGIDDYITTGITNYNGTSFYAGTNQQWTIAARAACASNETLAVFTKQTVGTTAIHPISLILWRAADAASTPVILVNGSLNFTSYGLDDGLWHHYAITWDRTNALLYVDGVQRMTMTVGTNSNVAESIPISIGRYSTSIYGTGQITDVLAAPVALTSNQIWRLSR